MSQAQASDLAVDTQMRHEVRKRITCFQNQLDEDSVEDEARGLWRESPEEQEEDDDDAREVRPRSIRSPIADHIELEVAGAIMSVCAAHLRETCLSCGTNFADENAAQGQNARKKVAAVGSRQDLRSPTNARRQRRFSDTWLMRAVTPKETFDEMEEIDRKKMMTDPDGNIYRGWAIGLHRGTRLMLVTLAVALLQVLAPVAILIATVPKLLAGEFVYIWTSGASLEDVTTKIVGGLFLVLVFFNGEIILSRTDLQTDRLRDLYHKRLKGNWMFVDAFCNSWVIAVCAVATPCLLWTSDDAKYMVMDAFGVLFLHNLDDYSGDVEYGVETSEFDDLIEKRILEHSKKVKSRRAGMDHRADMWQSYWMHGCFIHGDICYSVGRLCNQMSACFLGPAFTMLKWVEQSEGEASSSLHTNITAPTTSYTSAGYLTPVFCFQMLAVSVLFTYRVLLFVRKGKSTEIVRKDCIGFCSRVFFGRHDPRAPPQIV